MGFTCSHLRDLTFHFEGVGVGGTRPSATQREGKAPRTRPAESRACGSVWSTPPAARVSARPHTPLQSLGAQHWTPSLRPGVPRSHISMGLATPPPAPRPRSHEDPPHKATEHLRATPFSLDATLKTLLAQNLRQQPGPVGQSCPVWDPSVPLMGGPWSPSRVENPPYTSEAAFPWLQSS